VLLGYELIHETSTVSIPAFRLLLSELAAFSSTQRNNAEDPFDEFQNVGKDNFFVIFVASSMKNQCSQQWT
jgi:hypothetical protein